MVSAAPTRRTLVFPSGAAEARRSSARVPVPRPSERPTVPTLPPVEEADSGTSNTEIIELSASALESCSLAEHLDGDPRAAAPSVPALPAPRSSSRARARASLSSAAAGVADALSGVPRGILGMAAARGVLAQAALGAAAVALIVGVASPVGSPWALSSWGGAIASAASGAGAPRVARQVKADRTALASHADEPVALPPAGGCAAAGHSRLLAPRAHIASGLDVGVVESGFGVGYAASAEEAVGVRLDPALAHGESRVRVKGTLPVRHLAIDATSSEADGDLDLRVDSGAARTVIVEGGGAPVRLEIVGGRVMVSAGRGAPAKAAWAVPGAAFAAAAAPPAAPAAAAPAAPARAATRTASAIPDGIPATRVPRPPVVAFEAPVEIRAAARDGGGAVVVLRRASTIFVGLLDADLAAEGPLVTLERPGVAIGNPAVSAFGGGAAIAWAERRFADKEWSVVVASVGAPDDAARNLRVVGAGMSPSLAALPDGDLLLAHAVGGAGAHRVVAHRLVREAGLAPRGEPVFVSPEGINAGQPAAAVAPDGRALVAFFAAGPARASLLATPLVCDPGL